MKEGLLFCIVCLAMVDVVLLKLIFTEKRMLLIVEMDWSSTQTEFDENSDYCFAAACV
jgi:hypothetical protein